MSTHEFDTTGPERPREDRTDPQGHSSGDRSGERPRRSGWHPVNTGHLVMGVAFSGLVVVWALVKGDVVDLADNGWVMGLPWLAAGAVGLLATVLRGPRDHGPHHGPHHGSSHHGSHGSGTMHGWH